MPAQRGLVLESPAFDEVKLAWEKAIDGQGAPTIITCKTYGHAVAFRQKMYRWRRLMQKASPIGYTAFDDMVIILDKGDNRLYVKVRDEGVISIEKIPTTVGMEVEEVGDKIIANWPKAKLEPII